MHKDVVILITEERYQDEIGNWLTRTTTRDVLCNVKSIGRTEFYAAAQTDFKPAITIELADYRDYEGERILFYGSERYSIIRTFRNGKRLDLTCEKKVKDNGESD